MPAKGAKEAVKAEPTPGRPAPAAAPSRSRAPRAPKPFVPPARTVEPEMEREQFADEPPQGDRAGKQKYARVSRIGKESGKTTIFFNVGRKQLVTPSDLVGKIAGVTRLPGDVVGAIDIHQRHSLVDVDNEQVELILTKMLGIRIKGEVIKPALATTADLKAE